MRKISIVLPARNEGEAIGVVLDKIEELKSKCRNYDFETIVVIDHCTDATVEIAKSKNVIICYNQDLPGKGNVLREGFQKASGDIIAMLDADGSHNPMDLPKFFEAIESGYPLVIGSRVKGGSDEYGIIRLFGNISLTLLFCALFKVSLTDVLNGYKVFIKEIYNRFNFSSSGFEIEIEILSKAINNGYKITEISSHEFCRQGGKSKSNIFKDGLRFLFVILKEGLSYRFKNYLGIPEIK